MRNGSFVQFVGPGFRICNLSPLFAFQIWDFSGEAVREPRLSLRGLGEVSRKDASAEGVAIRFGVIDRLHGTTKQPRRAVQPFRSAAPSALDVLGDLFLGLASSA